MLEKYRIRRVDPKNLTIQRKRGKEWRTVSYHGNNLDSLILGLFDLVMAQHTPNSDNILEALAEAKLALDSGIEDVKKMVERDCKKL